MTPGSKPVGVHRHDAGPPPDSEDGRTDVGSEDPSVRYCFVGVHTPPAGMSLLQRLTYAFRRHY